ncbi:ubiquinol-cytochrome c reductase hinge protein [Rhinolophus ferrumequinum]|uniref:Ubiquinol-cytochrome c reductase hinge protein n=1 Tax=Rhinolophus ferrumequinum TaxID=59479 RepID=A0A7J7X9J1_RHIFE|nr:ubiquinol-cytochrome c reductase hinge protein [Rhinolophus ferrumequinum]
MGLEDERMMLTGSGDPKEEEEEEEELVIGLRLSVHTGNLGRQECETFPYYLASELNGRPHSAISGGSVALPAGLLHGSPNNSERAMRAVGEMCKGSGAAGAL